MSDYQARFDRRLAELEAAKASQHPPVVAEPVEPDVPRADLDTDDDDEPREARETDSIGAAASWTPDPRRLGREFIRAHPDAAISIDFPVVFEEDRSKMIADLTAARAEGVVAHRRLAERVAKELGIEQYDYKTEQAAIRQEDPAMPRMTAGDLGPVGSGDRLASDLDHDDADLDNHGKRDELSDESTRRFRRQQRTTEAAPTLLFKSVERDVAGHPTRVVEAYSGGRIRAYACIYDDAGRLVGLEPESDPESEAQDS